MAPQDNGPLWTIADDISRAAKEVGGFAELERRIVGVSRIKLSDMANRRTFCISTGELAALDRFFAPRGEGFGDRPLFIKRSLLADVAENEVLECFVGAMQRRSERNDVSLWDVKAFHEVLKGAQQFRHAIQSDLQAIPFRNEKDGQNRSFTFQRNLLEQPKCSVCTIGSMRSNIAAELLLCEMFGFPQFEKNERAPFKFLWHDYPVENFASAFLAHKADALATGDLASVKLIEKRRSAGAIIVDKQLFPTIPKPKENREWFDYGIVAAQRRANDRVRLVLMGLSGPSTYACAVACRSVIQKSIPYVTGNADSPVLWALIRATVAETKGAGDIREVKNIELHLGPHEFTKPAKD